MAGNGLDDGCVHHLNDMLARNGTLKHLSLAANLLTDNSVLALADCLEVSQPRFYGLSKLESGVSVQM